MLDLAAVRRILLTCPECDGKEVICNMIAIPDGYKLSCNDHDPWNKDKTKEEVEAMIVKKHLARLFERTG